jgi:hypothetical protein
VKIAGSSVSERSEFFRSRYCFQLTSRVSSYRHLFQQVGHRLWALQLFHLEGVAVVAEPPAALADVTAPEVADSAAPAVAIAEAGERELARPFVRSAAVAALPATCAVVMVSLFVALERDAPAAVHAAVAPAA